MSAIQRLIGMGLRPFAERRGRRRSLHEAASDLESSGVRLDAHLAGKPDTPANREAIAHCVGIERWGLRRLRVALGEPLVLDAYHGYRPDTAVGIDALSAAMPVTRTATVALARELAATVRPWVA